MVKCVSVEYIGTAPAIHQHLGEAHGAHDQADHDRVAPRLRDAIRMVFLIEGDGHLGALQSHRGSEGVDSIHLLLGDAALPVGFRRLGALEDHEAALSLGELIVLQGIVCQVTGLWGKLLALPY
jgi:hypothetical protein